MASGTSTDLKLELITTGEKSGTWGSITNTNLQVLEQAASGYISLAVGGANVALSLATYATSNGKNLYFKLTGTLTANRTVTIPDGAERVMIFEDATTRGTAPLYTLIVKTVSGSGVTLPVGSTSLVYSDGTNVNLGLSNKGYVTLNSSAITAYTAVNKDQVLANTSANPITVTLPASPSTGNEVTFIDARATFGSNNLIINRNSSNILSNAANLVLSTNGAAFTLVYIDSTRGWAYKDNI